MSSFAHKLARLDPARRRPTVVTEPVAERWVEPAVTRLEAFRAQPGPRGTAHVSERRHALGMRLGTVPLDAALDANPRLLARLGLDKALGACALERALYLDTETTGLGGGTGNRAFLVGMGYFDAAGDAFVVEQLLLREPDDEPALLEIVRQRLAAAELFVTYNGKAFDVPLLRARMVMARVGALPERPHLDLLHVARRLHAARGWRMTLGAVERRVLGFSRGPDVAGAEVALRYAHYLYSGDEAGLDEVVTHNHQDTLSLVALTGHYGRGADGLEAPELCAVARVMRRAGDLDAARDAAELAVERASEHASVNAALYTRAQIAKRRGDKAAALADLERLAARSNDAEVRLELCKLYEHFARAPERALATMARGTSESPDAQRRRRGRLLRKLGNAT
jgi:uncharacterized protein